MAPLKAVNACVFSLLRKILVLGVSVLVGALFLQIVLRYSIAASIDVIDEGGRYMFVWLMFLTIAEGFREKSHMGVTVLMDWLPPRHKRTLALFVFALVVIFLAVIAVAGSRMAAFTMGQMSPTLEIAMGWIYLAAPVGAVLSLLAVIETLPDVLALPTSGTAGGTAQ